MAEKIAISNLKHKFYNAMHRHEMYHAGYLKSLTKAEKHFVNNDIDKLQKEMEIVTEMLKLSAQAKQEMDSYEKELKRRKAKY